MEYILIFIILAVAITYTLIKVVRLLRTKPTSVCDDCTGCNLKQEMKKNGKTSTHDCSCKPTP